MPLDDIFYKKPIKADPEKLMNFWRWFAIIARGIVSLAFGILLFLNTNNFFIMNIIGALILPYFPFFFIAVPLSKLLSFIIPYHSFSRYYKEYIYLNIIASLLYLICLVFALDALFYDLVLFDWFFGHL